ncbi:MAG: META domain-containing protein [Lysobacterales bacterium]|jgi:putative lipoprotein
MSRWLVLGLTMIMTVACSKPPEPPANEGKQSPDNTLMRTITGTVWYRERKALPPGAEVKVVLENQSRMDAPAEEITDYTHIVDGPGPFRYRLVYDPTKIDERMRYGLRATIRNQGQLLFTSTEHIDPFASPVGEPIEIMVSMVGANHDAAPPSANGDDTGFTETTWRLAEINGQAATPGAGGNELTLTLRSDESQVGGFSGCNQFTGGFTLEGDQLSFGPLVSTRKMCAEGMEQEAQYQEALAKVRRFELSEGSLSLFDGEGQKILLFNKAM